MKKAEMPAPTSVGVLELFSLFSCITGTGILLHYSSPSGECPVGEAFFFLFFRRLSLFISFALVVWLFGCLVVWLFGCLGVWVFGCLGGLGIYGILSERTRYIASLPAPMIVEVISLPAPACRGGAGGGVGHSVKR